MPMAPVVPFTLMVVLMVLMVLMVHEDGTAEENARDKMKESTLATSK